MINKILRTIRQLITYFTAPSTPSPDAKPTKYTTIAAVEKTPVTQAPDTAKNANDPWAVNLPKAVLRGVFAGIWVPLWTNPLTQFEANITIGKGLKTSWSITAKAPWKGYSFAAFTHIVRASLLFNTTPLAKDFFERHGYPSVTGKMLAFGAAGAVEGSIMSLRFLFMHQMHTTSALTVREVYQSMPKQEMLKSWGIACRYGVARDVSFWPMWAFMVDTIENQLLVSKQEETVAKWWEEFLIGATAGVVASPVSYPIHAALRRRLHHPEVSLLQDIKSVAHQASLSGQPLWKMMPQHVYKGFVPAALVILPMTMGMTNLAKHAADIAYERGDKIGFFKPKAKCLVVPQKEQAPESADEFLLKMSSC